VARCSSRLILVVGQHNMRYPEILFLIERIVGFLVNLTVCGVALTYFLGTRKRCLCLISLSAGISAVLYLLPQFAGTLGRFALDLASLLLWAIGFFMLLSERGGQALVHAQLDAPPNGGPTTRPASSGVTEGPPSVS